MTDHRRDDKKMLSNKKGNEEAPSGERWRGDTKRQHSDESATGQQ